MLVVGMEEVRGGVVKVVLLACVLKLVMVGLRREKVREGFGSMGSWVCGFGWGAGEGVSGGFLFSCLVREDDAGVVAAAAAAAVW